MFRTDREEWRHSCKRRSRAWPVWSTTCWFWPRPSRRTPFGSNRPTSPRLSRISGGHHPDRAATVRARPVARGTLLADPVRALPSHRHGAQPRRGRRRAGARNRPRCRRRPRRPGPSDPRRGRMRSGDGAAGARLSTERRQLSRPNRPSSVLARIDSKGDGVVSLTRPAEKREPALRIPA